MEENIALELKDVSVAYGAEPTVHNVSMKFKKNQGKKMEKKQTKEMDRAIKTRGIKEDKEIKLPDKKRQKQEMI